MAESGPKRARARAMLMTPAGAAAIAVVRLAGPGVAEFLRGHFSGKPAEGRCALGRFFDGERTIDEGLAVIGPGAEWAELHVHGGPWVVRSVLELAGRAGFEVVEGAEMRGDEGLAVEAVDGAGSDPIELEVMQHLPLARTELALRVLLAQREAWRELMGARAARERWEAMLADRSLWWLLHPPKVALVGIPNSGKSTLANGLFEQERSITADVPGTTRDWVGELANLDGLVVMLVDTPGVRGTEDEIEREAIARAQGQTASADLVVLVLDVTAPMEDQRELMERYPQALRIANKSDLPARWEAGAAGAMATVATEPGRLEEVRRAIRGRFGCEGMEVGRARWWTRRQEGEIRRAGESRAGEQ